MTKNSLIAGFIILIVILLTAGSTYYLYQTSKKQTTAPPKTTAENSIPQVPQTPQNSVTNQISLTITSPTNEQIFNTNSITLTGQTVANADVSVNDQDLVADQNGKFSAKLTLDEGENLIMITAVDNLGNSAEQEITVTYMPAE